MKIIVDTNIIFSGILNTNGAIGELLINASDGIEFYSCAYMRYEIQKHWQRLKKISKMSDEQLIYVQSNLFSRIKFINEELIPEEVWREAFKLTENIDVDDTDFVALAVYLNGNLWTGDKILYLGLKQRGFTRVLTTAELRQVNESLN